MREQSEMLSLVKARLEMIWRAGNYGAVGSGMNESAAEFVGRLGIPAGARVLDVACGTGQASIPAARAGALVTGVDIAPEQIVQARERALRRGVPARFDVGDAEDLPYGDGEFDIVISLIGAMFAPRPEVVTAEMARVLRPGGRLIMGNWIPEGFIGNLSLTLARYMPPADAIPSPMQWGDAGIVNDRLIGLFEEIGTSERTYRMAYPLDAAGLADHYIGNFGPVVKVFEGLDEAARGALRKELGEIWARWNTSGNGTTVIEARLLEVTATRR